MCLPAPDGKAGQRWGLSFIPNPHPVRASASRSHHSQGAKGQGVDTWIWPEPQVQAQPSARLLLPSGHSPAEGAGSDSVKLKELKLKGEAPP